MNKPTTNTKKMSESDFDLWLKLHEINIWEDLSLEEKVEAVKDYLLKFTK